MRLFFPHPRETGCYAWHGTKAVTLTWDAPLFSASGPGLSVSKIEPLGDVGLSLLLRVVESFPGAQSPLRSKEPILPFLSLHTVFVSSTLRKILTLSFRATATMATRDAMFRGWLRQTERKNSLNSASWRIADQEP